MLLEMLVEMLCAGKDTHSITPEKLLFPKKAIFVNLGRIKKIQRLKFKVKRSKSKTGIFLMGHSKMRQNTVEVQIMTDMDLGVSWMAIRTLGNTAMCHCAMEPKQSR